MKKYFLVFIFCLTSLLGVDISSSTNTNTSLKKDKSISVKNSFEEKVSNSVKKSEEEKSDISYDITFDTLPIFFSLSDECIQTPKLITDFGVKYKIGHNSIDLTAKQAYESFATSNEKIKNVKMDESSFKKYLKCLANGGAKIAQANLNFMNLIENRKNLKEDEILELAIKVFDNSIITNPTIKSNLFMFEKSLKNDCRFFNSLNQIQCGITIFDFTSTTLKTLKTNLFSSESSNASGSFYGISSNFKFAVNKATNNSIEIAKDNSNSKVNDTSLTKTKSGDISSSTKEEISVGKFIPNVN